MSAVFSEDRKYRYTLWREWPMACGNSKSYVQFIGLNPSTADEVKDDPTIRRCKGYAKAWGFGRMCMTNLFAFRATNPREMMGQRDPIGKENDKYLVSVSREASLVVAAWGRMGEFMGRDEDVLDLLDNVFQIGEAEYPRHPLYLKKDLLPTEVQL